MNYNLSDTIVAISTPKGIGGVGIVRLSGSKSFKIASLLSKKNKIKIGINYAHLFNKDNTILDQCLIIYFKSPKSFTGEDIIEFNLHGNDLILDTVISMCIDFGARLARSGEFSLRSYLNGKIDLIQAESINYIVKSQSLYSNKFIFKSLLGSFSEEIKNFLFKLDSFRLILASVIEFPDSIFFDKDDFYLKFLDFYNLYVNFFKKVSSEKISFESLNITILGNVNVGKSSLFNSLLNKDRSIVSNVPGTTRDFIDCDLFINNIKFKLIDTAGFNFYTNDYLEKISIERTLNQSKKANILIFVEDAGVDFDLNKNNLFKLILDNCIDKIKIILFKNKIDLLGLNKKIFFHPNYVEIFGSVKNNEGIDLLIDEIISTSLFLNDDFYLVSKRNFSILSKIKNYLQLLSEYNKEHYYLSLEVFADYINIIYNLFSEIIGINVSKDILEQIFSNFCVGK